jgi:NADH:ubiquinone oxidoreductase subunit F (NADH-binding)/NADH:ubiquinone oxidoreductase subunit E
MLVDALRQIQEHHGYLPREDLEFLAWRLREPLYRLQEVASFFPHFRLTPPPRVTVQICQSMSCHLHGAAELLTAARRKFDQSIKEGTLAVEAVSCLGRCDRAPVAVVHHFSKIEEQRWHDHLYARLDQPESPRKLMPLLTEILGGKHPTPDRDLRSDVKEPPLWQINVYDPRHPDTIKEPFAAVRQWLAGNLNGKAVLDALETAGLVGMGGAAARTGNKWKEVGREKETPKYVVANGDESEPGTFKDREILLYAPHLLVEAMLLAGLTVGAARAYIYIRHEYGEQIKAVEAAIERATREVPDAMEQCPVEVFVSPGAYICGEESALLEAMEGHRAQPRNQPPTIRTNGLFDRPTVVNNIETLAWVPAIVLRGRGEGYLQNPMRFFSISGDVVRPGAYEVPITMRLGDLIDQRAGGLRPGRKLQAVAPSGPSGGFLPARIAAAPFRQALAANLPGRERRSKAEAGRIKAFMDRSLGAGATTVDLCDLPLDEAVFRDGSMNLGAGIVIYDDSRPMLHQAINSLEFFAKESCGKCVPCRLGCQQLVQLGHQLRDNSASAGDVRATAEPLAQAMKLTSICGLGRAASNPLSTYLTHFAGNPQRPPASPSGAAS